MNIKRACTVFTRRVFIQCMIKIKLITIIKKRLNPKTLKNLSTTSQYTKNIMITKLINSILTLTINPNTPSISHNIILSMVKKNQSITSPNTHSSRTQSMLTSKVLIMSISQVFTTNQCMMMI